MHGREYLQASAGPCLDAGLQQRVAPPAADAASPSSPRPLNPQAGRSKADPAIGRHLADTLAAIPRLEPSDFERMFNDGIQDQLLVSYFANLVRSQVALAERLGTAALPLV